MHARYAHIEKARTVQLIKKGKNRLEGKLGVSVNNFYD